MRYRKRPVVVEAFQMTEAERLTADRHWPEWLVSAWSGGIDDAGTLYWDSATGRFYIVTLEGHHVVTWNDWIIRGVKGELYPIKPDIFAATYERVEDEPEWNLQREVEQMRARGVSATTGREMAVIAAAKEWREHAGSGNPDSDVASTLWTDATRNLMRAVDRLLEAEGKGATVLKEYIREGKGDESWQARRAELWDGIMLAWNGHGPSRDPIAAALDRAFEFGRGLR